MVPGTEGAWLPLSVPQQPVEARPAAGLVDTSGPGGMPRLFDGFDTKGIIRAVEKILEPTVLN